MGRVTYNQKGYVGCAMSENAVSAYMGGEKPKSKWTKAAMLEEIEDWCWSNDVEMDEGIRKLKKDEIFGRFFERTSWHHTGKFANVTDFYGLDEEAMEEHFGSEVENG